MGSDTQLLFRLGSAGQGPSGPRGKGQGLTVAAEKKVMAIRRPKSRQDEAGTSNDADGD